MATIDDVEQGVCSTLASLLFPGQAYLSGSVGVCSAPWIGSVGAPMLAPQVRLGIGEPSTNEMEQDLRNAISNVAIVRVASSIENCTFLKPRWIQSSFYRPTLSGSLQDGGVCFGGIAGAGMVAGVTAERVCYAYRCVSGDTPQSVAAGFASIIPGAVSDGSILLARSVSNVNIVADQIGVWCTGQRQAMVQAIIIATPTSSGGVDGPLVRSVIGRLVYEVEALRRSDGSLTRFIGLPDGTMAQIWVVDERDDDAPRRNDMWKRVITFRLLYDSGVAEVLYSVLAPMVLANADAARILWVGNGAPVSRVLTDGNGNVLGDSSGTMLGII